MPPQWMIHFHCDSIYRRIRWYSIKFDSKWVIVCGKMTLIDCSCQLKLLVAYKHWMILRDSSKILCAGRACFRWNRRYRLVLELLNAAVAAFCLVVNSFVNRCCLFELLTVCTHSFTVAQFSCITSLQSSWIAVFFPQLIKIPVLFHF